MSGSAESLALSIRGSDNYSFHRVQLVGLLFVLPVVLGTLILNVLPTVRHAWHQLHQI